MIRLALYSSLLLAFASGAAGAASFTYRGQLNDEGVAANGRYDLQLQLYADQAGKRALVAPIDLTDIEVRDGQFAVAVELPEVLADTAWIEASVRPVGEFAWWPLGAKEAVALKGAVCPASWELSGNAGTIEGTSFLGTTDNRALELRSNNVRVGLLQANGSGAGATANVSFGAASNRVNSAAASATISGGNDNLVNENAGSIGGGEFNSIGLDDGSATDARWASIGGGLNNVARGEGASIGGGVGNRALGSGTTVAGGTNNVANGQASTIGGGGGHDANGLASTIGGGSGNRAAGANATVSGGSNNSASGSFAVVPGGTNNCAGADSSMALGSRAKIRPGSIALEPHCATQAATNLGDVGTFAWADSQNADFVSSGEDQFLIRARGGVGINATPIADAVELSIVADADDSDTANLFLRQRSNSAGFLFSSTGATSTGANDADFFIDHFNGAGGQARRLSLNGDGSVAIRSNITGAATGVTMPAGSGAWSNLSDRHVKTAIARIDPVAILDRLVSLPISEWSYTAQGEGVRHLGPMAQDFAAAFKLGENDTTISSIDADGVALAAIQGLNAKLERENAELRARLDAVEGLVGRLEALEQALQTEALRRSDDVALSGQR